MKSENSLKSLKSFRGINGGTIKFKNRKCKCGKKAIVKISESKDHPNMLFFVCDKCGFFQWWEPDEFTTDEFTEEVTSTSRPQMDTLIPNSARVDAVEANQNCLKLMMIGNFIFSGIMLMFVVVVIVALLLK